MTDRTMTLTVASARALGDRLFNRSVSKLTEAPSSEKADWRMASRLLWALLRERHAADTITIPADE